jgi:hypothetical protein
MPPATSSTSTTRPRRLRRSIVGRGGPIRPSPASWLDIRRRCRFFFGDGELLQPARCGEELVAVHVCVARDSRKVGVTEVLGDEAGVADLLAEPGRGCVAQRVGGDVLLDSGALGGAADDVGEDRLLEASARKPAEHGVGRLGLSGIADVPQLLGRLFARSSPRRAARLECGVC